MFLKVLIPIICVLLGFFVYNISVKIIKPMMLYLKECRIFLIRLKENKTIFLKRVEDKSYIEYGIEKVFIYNIKKDIFLLSDKNNDIRMLSKHNKMFFILNRIIIKKFLNKHNDDINDYMDYKGSLLDRRTYNLMNLMINITLQTLKDKKDLSDKSKIEPTNLEETMDFDIDDILDKINKIGYLNLTDKEKEFLNNHN